MEKKLTVNSTKKVYFVKEPVHMGLAHAGLVKIAESKKVKLDRGAAIIFHNKQRTKAKVLVQEDGGFSFIYKSMTGSARFPEITKKKMTQEGLDFYFQGETVFEQNASTVDMFPLRKSNTPRKVSAKVISKKKLDRKVKRVVKKIVKRLSSTKTTSKKTVSKKVK